jgi:hypothetical protein
MPEGENIPKLREVIRVRSCSSTFPLTFALKMNALAGRLGQVKIPGEPVEAAQKQHF